MAKRTLEHLSLTELQREIERRQKQLERQLKLLHDRRSKLLNQVEELESEIAECEVEIKSNGGDAGGRKRPRNKQRLADALAQALSSEVMTVTEVARAVQEAGYRTTSPNFRTIVNQTLLKDARFKRVGRGRYTVKESAKK